MNAGHEGQKLFHVHVEVERIVLGQVTHALAHLHGVVHHVETTHLRLARTRRDVTGQHFHGGRFAGAVRTEKTHHFARFNRERYAVHGALLAVQLGDVAKFN